MPHLDSSNSPCGAQELSPAHQTVHVVHKSSAQLSSHVTGIRAAPACIADIPDVECVMPTLVAQYYMFNILSTDRKCSRMLHPTSLAYVRFLANLSVPALGDTEAGHLLGFSHEERHNPRKVKVSVPVVLRNHVNSLSTHQECWLIRHFDRRCAMIVCSL